MNVRRLRTFPGSEDDPFLVLGRTSGGEKEARMEDLSAA